MPDLLLAALPNVLLAFAAKAVGAAPAALAGGASRQLVAVLTDATAGRH